MRAEDGRGHFLVQETESAERKIKELLREKQS